MRRWLVVFLIAVLMPLYPIYAQTINVSVMDWTTLRTELLNSKTQLAILNSEVKNLEDALQRARESQQNSEQKINALEGSQVFSGMKISDLETQLALAKEQRDQFQMRVENSENQLVELGVSLASIQSLLDQNEAKQIVRIENLVTGYERRMVVKNVVIGTLIAVIIGGTIYTLAAK